MRRILCRECSRYCIAGFCGGLGGGGLGGEEQEMGWEGSGFYVEGYYILDFS